MKWQSILMALLLRPILLAAAAWFFILVFRVKQPAMRHMVWTGVLAAMLVLPVVIVLGARVTLPVLPQRVETAAATATGGTSAGVVDDFTSETNTPRPSVPASSTFRMPSPDAWLVALYIAGLLAMTAYRFAGWMLLRRVLVRARPVRSRVLESADVLTPVAIGVLRPGVILPASWRTWDRATRRAVLSHEFAHLRRRDGLISALSRLVRSLFWFHPLAWWIAREIGDLAEMACDAAVLERSVDPAGYSRMLLEFAARVNSAGQRVAMPGLAMGASSDIGKRIDQVFAFSKGPVRKAQRTLAWVALLGVPVACLAATAELGRPRPRIVYPAIAPVAASVAVAPVATVEHAAVAQNAPSPAPVRSAPIPKFEVASVKPATDCGVPPLGGGGRGGGPGLSPGRLDLHCRTLMSLITTAYVQFANGRFLPQSKVPVSGGPAWINSDRFDIDAKADGEATPEMMRGPMLQALLEERFHLEMKRETHEIPVYNLAVAKGGPKLKRFDPGTCQPIDISRLRLPGEQPESPLKPCTARGTVQGLDMVLDVEGWTVDEFCQMYLGILDRPVVNKTGLAGRFVYHLEYRPDDMTPGFKVLRPADGADEPGPTIMDALTQQLGLRLELSKGPGESLTIVRADRPSEN